jgi:C4-dicarboxylate-specific signal transduction histidine kinase
MARKRDAAAARANGADQSSDGGPQLDPAGLREQVEQLEQRVRRAEERRRALVHIMGDLNESNRKLEDQRKAMLHILGDYERDRSRLARQTERLDNSRRALLHILKDSHESNLKLGDSRKAMIHIMGDLRETTQEMEHREQELRDKQEQLVQAGKLATLGELTTGVAHELNNPLNNIGLFVGNVIDQIRLGQMDTDQAVRDLEQAMEQVRKATEIISHLRTFGRAAPVAVEQVDVDDVIERSLLLVQEQFRLRGIDVELELCPDELLVLGNPIQLEQVFINLLTNARDALETAPKKAIRIASARDDDRIRITFSDTGPGIPPEIAQRIFDPFFTTKEVGAGTGLGLSITYSILKEYGGDISVVAGRGKGATFEIELPQAQGAPPEEPLL